MGLSQSDSHNFKKEKLLKNNIFLGGPPHLFLDAGKNQLKVCKHQGLKTHHTILDIGCGSLRGGYWFIKFLDPECYYGIEPHKERLNVGSEIMVGEKRLKLKKPTFNNNDEFDFGVFGVRFNFIIARSIWSHATQKQITKMLDEFIIYGKNKSKFLTSVILSEDGTDYEGDGWVGRSAVSNEEGTVKYSWRWIKKECRSRGIKWKKLPRHLNIGNQIWICLYLT